MTLGAFDLLEGLDVFVFGPVHDRQDFRVEVGFIAGPVAIGTRIQRLQEMILRVNSPVSSHLLVNKIPGQLYTKASALRFKTLLNSLNQV